jgi:uncharacterized protein HemX
MEERGFLKYLPLAAAALLIGLGIALFGRQRKPRSFREDPIGALKDHSEIVANKAHEATEEALTRIQESLDEIRGRLPEINRKRLDKRRKEINKRLVSLSDQAQELLKEVRSNSVFSR